MDQKAYERMNPTGGSLVISGFSSATFGDGDISPRCRLRGVGGPIAWHTYMRKTLVLLLGVVVPLSAELPDFYKSVDRVFWVVDDIDRTVAGGQKLGIIDVRPNPGAGPGVRWSIARLGDTVVDFIQPLDDKSPFAAYRKKHGQGIMALIHHAPTKAAVEQELARMANAGVAVLEGRNLGTEGRYV